MSPKPFDIIAVGNAIVDVFGQVDDQFLLTHGIEKNVMTLLDADRFARLYDALTDHKRPQLVSGGSAANTAVGVAAFGGAAAFVGRVFDDALGAAFTADIRAAGVAFNQPGRHRIANRFIDHSCYTGCSALNEYVSWG